MSEERVPQSDDRSASDDLATLVASMTVAQLFAFKNAVVHQAVYCAEKVLPPENEDEGERGCLQMARRWLEHPTPEVARYAVIFATMESVDGGLRYFDYDPLFIEPVEAAGTELTPSGVVRAAAHARKATRDDGGEGSFRWQLAAAGAILRGDDVPPLPLPA